MKLIHGINLGGYLSQCVHTQEHYRTFICEEDLQIIAEMGYDHVRLPIDYNVLETDEGKVIESGYAYVDQVIAWSHKYGLDIILDLHKAYGYDFNNAGDAEQNNLFSSEPLMQRFVDLWSRIAKRYAEYDFVAFELLNEVVEAENAQVWNNLIRRAVAAIRVWAPTAPIIYGGICWNSATTLKLLEKPTDPNIIFTFHFYEPLLFTHQKAYWVAAMDPNQTVYYPKSMEYFKTESQKLGYQGGAVFDAKSLHMGQEFMEEVMQSAIDAASAAGVRLYCGEYGVIDQAPLEDTLRWFTDVETIFHKFGIGRSVWTYKKMDFGLIDEHYTPIREALLKLIRES